jgi:hypothetical protein
MKVISASRRTDIPAFYSRWFLNRIRAGFCHWINPYGGQICRVSLRAEDCLAIVFWTRYPRPLLPHLDGLRAVGYSFYFHITVNGYPRAIERANPPLDAQIEVFRRTAAAVSPELTHWRYDPIVLSSLTPPEYHLEQFDAISRRLEGATMRCYLSFVDRYGKTERNLGRVARERDIHFLDPSPDEQRRLVLAMRDIARPRGITLYACCEAQLVGGGIAPSRCIDLDTIRRLRADADIRLRNAPTRAECGCVEAVDIGAYDTCAFGCAYCYATNSHQTALRRLRAHNPMDTVLLRPARLYGADLTSLEQRPKSSGRPTATRRAALPLDLVPAPPDRP